MASISIIFRKDKLNSKGESPIHFRIIKDRKINYISTGISIQEDHWDSKKNCIKVKHPNSARLNSFLANKFTELQDQVFEHETLNKSLTGRQLRDKIYGKKPTDFFPFADEVLQKYIRKGDIGTHDKNASVIKKLKSYVNDRNIAFQDITVDFLLKYERYLQETLFNKTNTITNNFRFIRKVFNDAYKQDIIEHNIIPFNKFQLKTEKSERVYLTEEELTLIENFSDKTRKRLDLHKNMFIFAAYTGLRVSDMLQLQWKHYTGEHINFTIKKTGNQMSIKLPNKAILIIEKYRPTKVNKTDFIFDMLPNGIDLSNPRVVDKAISSSTAYINKNLYYIAESLELEKHISFHIARHTFATRALRKGISIDKVSKLLGHAQIRETQIYAKIVSSELDKAMDVFNE